MMFDVCVVTDVHVCVDRAVKISVFVSSPLWCLAFGTMSGF